jgi:FkbM family methyltransferase
MGALNLLRFILDHPVNRGQPLAALVRFARWQLGSRLIGAAVLHDWVGGSRFVVRRGETGISGNLYTGLHEFADMAFVLHAIRPEDWFFDVGANVGSYTLLACAAGGGHGMAFEPLPETFRRLCDNLALNRLEDRVHACNIGVGAGPGRILFSAALDTMNHAIAPGESAAGAIEVPVLALDEAASGRVPTLMKIDVEGFETPVLQGASATLASTGLKAVIVELNGAGLRYGYDDDALLRQMLDLGFRTYAYDPTSRELTDCQGRRNTEGNTLFVRDLAFIQARLRDAPPFEVLGRRF